MQKVVVEPLLDAEKHLVPCQAEFQGQFQATQELQVPVKEGFPVKAKGKEFQLACLASKTSCMEVTK
ncbi:MAG: hypothetical protein JNM57_14545 [Cyclobacteriaceae bacterium]|nr:hypothetical protein [Cyclobacteriaceae bacterium]